MRREALVSALLVALAAPAVAGGASPSRATLELRGGGLSVSGPGMVEMPAVRLAGRGVTVEAPMGPFRVVDTRGDAPGWSLVARADRPVDALGRRIGTALQIVPPVAPPGLESPQREPAALDTPRVLMRARAGRGTGSWSITPVLRLSVPAGTPSGTYATTLVVTIS